MTIDRFWNLFSKKQADEASSAELNELEEMSLSHPEWKRTAEILSNLNFQSTVFENDEDVENAFEDHLTRMKNAEVEFGESEPAYEEPIPRPQNRKSKKWLIPAVVAVAMIVTVLFLSKNSIVTPETRKVKQANLNGVSTPAGSKTQIRLPDGSLVRLNASSSLTYDKNFGRDIREVSLVGEAFFDVTKDSSHPFIIHTNVIDIKVVGTAFDVKSYPNDANTETSLIRGKVEVTVKGRSNEKVYLEPNEKLIVANNSATINRALINEPVQGDKSGSKPDVSPKPIYSVQHLTYHPVDSTIIETSWVDNKLIFQQNETFKEVALRLERWYAVKIHFDDEEVAQMRPFGSFTTETINDALDALQVSLGFKYKIVGNEITITK